MNREDVANDLAVENNEILRGRLEQAEALLREMRTIFSIPPYWHERIDALLSSQQGEQHSCKNCLGVDPESCLFKHPEQAEGAQGEREAFEAHESRERRLPPADQKFWFRRGVLADYDCKAIDDAWKAWKARAALAQPSPKPGELVVTRNEVGAIVAITRQDAEGRVLNVLAEAQPSTALELDYTHMSRRMLEELAKVGKCLVATADLERLTQERDAAQDRVAELEKQEPEGYVQSLPLKDHQPCRPGEDRANGYTIPVYSRPFAVEDALCKLRAVLCDPVGNVVIEGSDGDREEVQRALGMLAAAPAQGE